MSHGFLRIGFTLPDFVEGEADRMVALLDSGIGIMHIRKPGAALASFRALIQAIPERYHPRLRIHDHFELIEEFRLAGVHVNSRNPLPPDGCTSITRSCHSLQELSAPLPDGRMPEYQTLSPIFDSISKPGYSSRFDIDTLRPLIIGKNVVALGGITPDMFDVLEEAGFIGAAMLGSLWT